MSLVASGIALAGSDGWGFLTAVFLAVALVPPALVAVAERRSTTTLHEDGVVVHDGLLRPRTHRWEDVSTVVVEGPYAERSVLRLRDWNEVPLPHVPAEVAQLLRDQLDPHSSRPPRRRAVPGAALPGGTRPRDDLDLEGPFRRGPRRPPAAPGSAGGTP